MRGSHRVSTACTLSAGPPMPAVTLVNPETAPATSALGSTGGRWNARRTSIDMLSASTRIAPTLICSTGPARRTEMIAPGTMKIRAGMSSMTNWRQSIYCQTRVMISVAEIAPHRFTMSTPSKAPSSNTSIGAEIIANPRPATRWASAPRTTARITRRYSTRPSSQAPVGNLGECVAGGHEGGHGLLDVLGGVSSGELHPDPGRAAGHHRVGERGDVHAAGQHLLGHPGRHLRIPEHHRDD